MNLLSAIKQIPAAVLPARLFTAKNTQGCVVLAGVGLDQLSTAVLAQVGTLPVYQLEHQPTAGQFASDVNTNVIHQSLDLTNADAVAGFFKQLQQAGQHVALLIVQGAAPLQQATPDLQASDLQQRWQSTGLAAVAVAQAAIGQMLAKQQGTLIFLGSTHACNPGSNADSGWLADAAVQAGVRALSQSLAREFQPKGIHISYLALTEWSSHSEATAQAIASTCWHVHLQPQSTWSQELSA